MEMPKHGCGFHGGGFRGDATEAHGAYLLLILDCYATASRNRHDPRRSRQAAGRGVDQEAPQGAGAVLRHPRWLFLV